MSIATKLSEQGIILPRPAAPLAAYVPYVVVDGFVFISGQLPMQDGAVAVTGHLGRDVTLEDGARGARIAAINVLAQLGMAVEGDLERITRCVRLGGFVSSAPDFYDHHKVINGASELMQAIFGEAGRHARAAVGVSALPLNAAVEVEAVFSLNP